MQRIFSENSVASKASTRLFLFFVPMFDNELSLPKKIISEIRDLYRYRLVTFAIVTSSLKTRYKRSVLGVGWSLLGPTLNYLVMGFVFSKASKIDQPNYFVFLFSGAVIYNLMSAIILQSPGVFINNEHFIKKIYLPKSIFVLNQSLIEIINFLFAVTSLLVLGFLFSKLDINLAAISLPITVINAALFAFGICSILGVITVYYRDFIHLIPLGMQAIFFATPVLYPVSLVPEKYVKFIHLNPFYYFVESFRTPLLGNHEFNVSLLGITTLLGITSALSGLFILKIFDNKIVFKL